MVLSQADASRVLYRTFTANFIARVIHLPGGGLFFDVNNQEEHCTPSPQFPAFPNYSRVIHMPDLVNNSVDMISLLECENVIICFQFIERTEMSGGGQQIDVARLKDNPR